MSYILTKKGSITAHIDKRLVKFEQGREYKDKDVEALSKEEQKLFEKVGPKEAEKPETNKTDKDQK